jgi:glycogen debranching enzyme
VLDRNWRGNHTVPSGELYPHQWSWDTAFIAIGRSWIDQQRAQAEIEHLFTGQWANGMVPHIVFNRDVPDDAYFPGPTFWRSDRADASPRDVATSGITQPPLHARAVLEIYRRATDRHTARLFIDRMYPKLVALGPVLDPRLPAATVDMIAALLDSPEFRPRDDPGHFMVPSFDLRARGFDPRRYWRGPIWINTDWLLWRGLTSHGRTRLADEIAASMVGLVRRSGWREYFSPFGGRGFGSDAFSWTAALIIDLLHRTAGAHRGGP